MRRRRAFLAGALLLFWMKCAVADSEWPMPMFLKPDNLNENVTWTQAPYDYMALVDIFEGMESSVEIARLSYKAQGDDVPTIDSGAVALGPKIGKDSSTSAPFFLEVTEAGDFEAGRTRFSIRVSAPGATRDGQVTIVLVNINDNPPTITSPPSCLVKEEFVGITNCKFTVTDPDGGAYYADMSVDDEKFSLELSEESTPNFDGKTATFILHVKSELDYETFRLHNLQITAVDKGQIGEDEFLPGGYVQTRTVSFVVDVEDIPDEEPRWETIMPSVTEDEKTPWERQLRAVDGDFGLNWPIVYHLEFPDEKFDYKSYFSINKETGLLTGLPIDRDDLQREIFKFLVVATEVPPRDKYPEFVPMFTSNDIVVMVNDINDNIPTLKPTEVSYLEFPEEQPFTDRNFTVEDPDLADHGTFHLTLEENFWSKNFLLIPSTGYQEVGLTISALDPSLLDYEDPEWRVIELTIIAEEEADKAHTTKAVLHIELLDLIDEPPEFENEEYILTNITENQPEGFLVALTVAHDPDENDVISYSINNPYMQIDDEGRITTVNADAFDYERQTEISLQVVATDTGNMKDFCQVIIKLIDINDEQPTLILPSERYDVEEHAKEGERVSHDIKATDPDTQADLEFIIEWETSSAFSQGLEVEDKALYQNSVKLAETRVVGSEWITNLEVANSDEFDWEVFDTLRLQVIVIDKTTHPDYMDKERSAAILTVYVIDINDNPPVFIEEELRDNFTVLENTGKDRFIGSLIATDKDSPPNSQIKYSIVPTFPEQLVADQKNPRLSINPDTGVLSTTDTEIDCDEWSTIIFKFNVTATDGLHVTTEEITLYIEDDNDEYPKVLEPGNHEDTATFEEHEPGPHLLTCITGDDMDYTEAYHTITYYIVGDGDGFFEINSTCLPQDKCCLYAKDGSDMDREKKETYLIEVLSRDNYEDGSLWKSNPGPTVWVTLTLKDINDNAPEFQKVEEPWSVTESLAIEGYKFFDVDVTDADIGPNGEIECEEEPEVTSEPKRPAGLFTVKTLETEIDGDKRYKCAVYATADFSHPTESSHWGVYSLTLVANDKGNIPKNGTGTYVVEVKNENLKKPVITYPKNGEIIRLSNKQNLNSGRPLESFNGSEISNFETYDLDDPDTPNGQVDLVLTDKEGGKTFDVREEGKNSGIFRLIMTEIPDKKVFRLTLVANDRPETGKHYSDPVDIDVYVIAGDSTPVFSEREVTYSFKENKTGLTHFEILPEARNIDDELLEERTPIYYFIIDGDAEYFTLDRDTRELRLAKELDYEKVTQHKITVGTTHKENPAEADFFGDALLEVTIEVIDINDNPPRFTQTVFPGAFGVDYDVGQHIIDLKAEDPDTNPILTYTMIPGTIKAHSESLQDFERDDAFLVNPSTGAITLNFAPAGRALEGYFSFDVMVVDEAEEDIEDHMDTASVNLFAVSETHLMLFYFYNTVDLVEEKKDDMAAEFSRILSYTCTVEKVRRSQRDVEFETSEVLTYFVDQEDKAPVLREVIEDELLKTNINQELYTAMQELSLSFRGYNTVTTAEENPHYLTIVLAAVCSVLFVLFVVFLLAFIVRTRTLNQRLDKLTSKKFGSQDSGLNRDSLAVPGTNRHALEGSNPVWNHDIDRAFDNISQSSGDSDLVGIEDSPEFNGEIDGVVNRAYEPRASVNPFEGMSANDNYPVSPPPSYDQLPRRTSINPLAAAAGAEGGAFGALPDPGPLSLEDIGLPRKISLNPLTQDFGSDLDAAVVDVDLGAGGDAHDASGNSNFSFQKPVEPSTEL